MLANIGTTELIIVAVIILLFFGSAKLKELARGLGESTKEAKKIQKELMNNSDEDEERKEVEDM